MAMEMQLAEDTSEKVVRASQLLGIQRQEFVDRAILLYLDNFEKYLNLKQEMQEWDVLSDEALLNFEKTL
ncbi:MAG TPA: hypothetical protein VJI32_04725 [Candidatus Nanoarchaeia archaeon]|nr:hypothetical protein [Candidatus Nanoarchaeia archaeon]